MSGGLDDEITRERILDAALAELTKTEIGRFKLESVAARAGLDPGLNGVLRR